MLRRECGPLWLQVADDLDHAIATFGEWVEARIEERQYDAMEVDRERVAAAIKAGSTGARSTLTRERLREIAEEAWWYYVGGQVRRYYNDPHGGVALWTKAATYDQAIDADWTKGDVRVTTRGLQPVTETMGGWHR